MKDRKRRSKVLIKTKQGNTLKMAKAQEKKGEKRKVLKFVRSCFGNLNSTKMTNAKQKMKP